jgi:transaldolase
VASFFLSRIDTAVDAELSRGSIAGKDVAPLHGTAAVASARIAYRALAALAAVGIDVERVAGDLEQGIAKFVEPYERLLDAIERRRVAACAPLPPDSGARREHASELSERQSRDH